MRKAIFPLLILFFLSGLLFSQEKKELDEILIDLKNRLQYADNIMDYNEYLKIKALLEDLRISSPDHYLLHYYLSLTNYRLAIYNIRKKEEKKAKEFIEEAIENIRKSIRLRNDFSDSHALLGAIYGLKIPLSPFQAHFLGPKSFDELDKGIELSPYNPRAYLLRGIGYLNTPSIFGGGLSRAINDLEKSIKLFEEEKNEDSIFPSWGICEAYTWLGICYKRKGENEKARGIFLKGLEKCPEYEWLKINLKKIEKEVGK